MEAKTEKGRGADPHERSRSSGGGGTFCRFRVGALGTSAAHLRYISRESAVPERGAGVFLYAMPPEICGIRDGSAAEHGAGHGADRYTLLRLSLIAHAWAREAAEPERGSAKRTRRTHYRVTLSFEQDVGTREAFGLLERWLAQCFPKGQAVAFLHRDTRHSHLHVWVDARGRDGKKLTFSARAYRQLDERWNALYAPFFGHAEEEHLNRKRAGKKNRGQQRRDTSAWRKWERKNAGEDELEKIRTGGAKPDALPGASPGDGREPETVRAERALTRSLRARVRGASEAARTDSAAQDALSETDRLRAALARLGGREQEREREGQRDLEKANDYERE